MDELTAAVNAVLQAGKYLKENFGRELQVFYKGQIDPVTELDRQAERIIADILLASYPEYGILGEEEHTSRDYKTNLWIVDPLDGTTNYSHGFPLYAVSIALEIDHQVQAGIVYNPVLEELFTAQKGGGAFLNDRAIHVSETKEIGHALLASGFPYDAWVNDLDNMVEWKRGVKSALSVRCDGCASLDLCHVAAGRLDGFWELDLEAWDMAAGALIVSEAGGSVTLATGEEFNPYRRSVLATNEHLHQTMLENILSRR